MSDVHGIARDQLQSYFRRWDNLEQEKARISDDLKELFKEAKALGYDGKALRIAFREKVKAEDETDSDRELRAVVDTYLEALNAPSRATRAYVRENKEKFDAETGEVLDGNLDPKLAHTIVTGLQTETGRAALIAAVDILIDREEAEEETHQRPSTNDEPYPEAGPQAEASPAGTGAGTLADREGRHDGEAASADLPTKSEISHSDEHETDRKAATPHAGANEGGDDVESSGLPAGLEGGPVNLEPTGPVAERATEFPDDGIRYEATPPMPMKSLPYASCFPELSKVEYDALTSVIKLQGVQEPIVRMGDVIVNGWNRYNIARSLGIEYPVIRYTGKDVLLDVIAMQREDRAWTSVQEQKIAARLAKEVPHRASEIMRAFQIEEELAWTSTPSSISTTSRRAGQRSTRSRSRTASRFQKTTSTEP